MSEDDFLKSITGEEWVVTETLPAESRSWEPSKTEGSVLFVQIAQGKFAKYVYQDGRYNLIEE